MRRAGAFRRERHAGLDLRGDHGIGFRVDGSGERADLVEGETRQLAEQRRLLGVPDIAEEVRERRLVPAKNSASTTSLEKPDIAPTSSPSARAAIIRYAPCSVAFRKAVSSA